MTSRKQVITALAMAASAALAAVSLAGPASAAEAQYSSVVRDGSPLGLLVHFKRGVEANGLFGTLNGQGALSAAGIPLGHQHALGLGWHVLDFSGSVSNSVALKAENIMRQQPGVSSVAINSFIAAQPPQLPSHLSSGKPSTVWESPLSGAGAPAPKPMATFKGATAVKKVSAQDAWSVLSPATPQVAVSWSAPANLYGFKLVGYKLQASLDSGVTYQDMPTTYSAKAKSAVISSGLTAGAHILMRVAALTSNGKVTKQGAWSDWAGAVPTTIPSAPNLQTSSVSSTVPTATWQMLSVADSGGLPVTYLAVASATGQPDVKCTTNGSSCSFVGLAPGVNYTVKVQATNKRGTSQFASGFTVSDPMYSLEWQLNSKYGINVEGAWQHTHGSSAVTVAVIDSGITAHPDLDSQEWRNLDGSVYGYDFVSSANGPDDGDGWDPSPMDPNAVNEWHGTHVSGLIAAANNSIGVVGVAPGAKLLEVRALGSKGGSPADLIAALNWAAGKDVPGTPKNTHPAQVINLSLGNKSYAQCDTATANVLQTLHDMNVMVITAAGNDNTQAFYSYPGNCYPTINVGATGFTGDRAYYSNYGQGVDISAPGGDDKNPGGAPAVSGGQVLSTLNDGTVGLGTPNYDYAEGTSMAAPMVSGIAALLYSVKPNITPNQIWDALKNTATAWPVGSFCSTAATDYSCGIGIANAAGAVEYALKNF